MGDFYLNKSSYELYGPKTSSGWGGPLNLKGADGNANVTRYLFPGFVFSSSDRSIINSVPNIQDEATMLQSAWLVYMIAGTSGRDFHYSMPGPGHASFSEYYMLYSYDQSNEEIDFVVGLRDGSGETYKQIEVVRIEASNTEDLTSVAGGTSIIPDYLNISSYEEVAKYYGFIN